VDAEERAAMMNEKEMQYQRSTISLIFIINIVKISLTINAGSPRQFSSMNLTLDLESPKTPNVKHEFQGAAKGPGDKQAVEIHPDMSPFSKTFFFPPVTPSTAPKGFFYLLPFTLSPISSVRASPANPVVTGSKFLQYLVDNFPHLVYDRHIT
jgi:hypothetical protein